MTAYITHTFTLSMCIPKFKYEKFIFNMSENILEYLDCAVCLNTFTSPVSLECGHAFCLECVISVQNNAKSASAKHAVCPYCRKPFKSRRKCFWNVCVPLAQMVDHFSKAQLAKSFNFHFDFDFDSLPEEILKNLP